MSVPRFADSYYRLSAGKYKAGCLRAARQTLANAEIIMQIAAQRVCAPPNMRIAWRVRLKRSAVAANSDIMPDIRHGSRGGSSRAGETRQFI
jgi:hypothetical protein